jgi:para-aminobenzoate synthetase component 1
MDYQKLPSCPDMPRLYQAFRDLPWPCWLDSGNGCYLDQGGRFHLLVADPRISVVSSQGITRLTYRDGSQERTAEPVLDVVRRLLKGRARHHDELPFHGGALGYFSYDFGRRLEGFLPEENILPEVALGIYDWAIIHDLRTGDTWLAGDEQAMPADMGDRLRRASGAALPPAFQASTSQVRRHVSAGDYARAFRRIQHYLREGDCYQVNYAQPFSLPFNGDVLALYLAMREQNPAPYGALMELSFVDVLSLSPEQFLRVNNGVVSTRPIKGTRPRDSDPARDGDLARQLLASEKDRAENLMIVDLLRNDLGRVCEPGSIRVPELFRVESYPTVHHLVSTITGRLAEGMDALDLLGACFPGGSITGAPKHRAMEIIQELEGRPREIYCGSLGWIGYDGNMDTSIAIRTLQIRNGVASYQAGGGIVADSRLDQEYQESLDKAAAFFRIFDSISGENGK